MMLKRKIDVRPYSLIMRVSIMRGSGRNRRRFSIAVRMSHSEAVRADSIGYDAISLKKRILVSAKVKQALRSKCRRKARGFKTRFWRSERFQRIQAEICK